MQTPPRSSAPWSIALLAFVAVIGLILFVVAVLGKRGDRRVAWFFVGPTALLLLVGLVYPAGRTIVQSFYDAAGEAFIGFDNYSTIFTSPDQLIVLRNTVLWVVVDAVRRDRRRPALRDPRRQGARSRRSPRR